MKRVSFSLGLAFLAAGCITDGPSAQSPGSPAGGAAAPAAGAAPGAAPSGPFVVWDGDSKAAGKGWADCSKKGECKTALEPGSGLGKSGAGLKFQAEGPEWMGFGWNWYGWWPDTSGDDISAYKELVFKVKIVAANPKEAPDPNSLTVRLGCSAGGVKDDTKKDTDDARVMDFAANANLLDGEWHEIAIPLSTFFTDKGKDFDKKTAWEMQMSTWAADPRKFEILVDDITFR